MPAIVTGGAFAVCGAFDIGDDDDCDDDDCDDDDCDDDDCDDDDCDDDDCDDDDDDVCDGCDDLACSAGIFVDSGAVRGFTPSRLGDADDVVIGASCGCDRRHARGRL
jgi:hypothetical protein